MAFFLLLCPFAQSLLRKLSHDDVQQISTTVMQAVVIMLNVTNALPSGGVQEDAIMTVSVLVECECGGQMVFFYLANETDSLPSPPS